MEVEEDDLTGEPMEMDVEAEEEELDEKQGYDDKEDESLGMRTGPEASKKQSYKDRREDSYGKWGTRDEKLEEELYERVSKRLSKEAKMDKLAENLADRIAAKLK